MEAVAKAELIQTGIADCRKKKRRCETGFIHWFGREADPESAVEEGDTEIKLTEENGTSPVSEVKLKQLDVKLKHKLEQLETERMRMQLALQERQKEIYF